MGEDSAWHIVRGQSKGRAEEMLKEPPPGLDPVPGAPSPPLATWTREAKLSYRRGLGICSLETPLSEYIHGCVHELPGA